MLIIFPIKRGIKIWAPEANKVRMIAIIKNHLKGPTFFSNLKKVPLMSFALSEANKPATRPAPPTPLETPGRPSSFFFSV
jgi:hypothetical protein